MKYSSAFLYYFARNSIVHCLILMFLQGLFYPHILLIEMTMLSLRLLVFKSFFKIEPTSNRQYYIWWILGLIVTAIAIYPLTQKPPELPFASYPTVLKHQIITRAPIETRF